MRLKEILNSFAKEDSEEKLQKWTDATIDFLFLTVPTAIYNKTIKVLIERYKIYRNHNTYSNSPYFKKFKQKGDGCNL